MSPFVKIGAAVLDFLLDKPLALKWPKQFLNLSPQGQKFFVFDGLKILWFWIK